MEHLEFKRTLHEADTAFLFIHGIVGTPNHFSPFLPLIPKDRSLWNLLLDGHGRGVKDFSATSMKKWEQQVQQAVDELSAVHNSIYIVAHSMGTLFAIEQAIREPKVKGLFLLAVPLSLSLSPRLVSNCTKVFFDRIKPDDHWAQAARQCYGIGRDKNPFNYIGWVPRYLELFQKIRQTRKLLPDLKTPTCAFQSAKDEMVSIQTIDILRQNPSICVHKLDDAGHFYYPSNVLDCLKSEFQAFIDQGGI